MSLLGRKHLNRLALIGVGAAVGVGGAWMAYRRLYAEPMAAARNDITRYRESARAYDAELDALPAIRARMKQIASTTLGTTEEEVAHRFRTLLHEVARQAGLSEIVVSEGRTSASLSPAQRARLVEFRSRRDDLRTADFAVMQGDIRASGSLESVARVLALAQNQPWIHRVADFSVTPSNDERTVFDVRVSVATLILPDIAPAEGAEQVVVPLGPDAELAWAPIVQRNVFRLPDPPVVVQAVVPPPPPPPPPAQTEAAPPPPYHMWRLTGIMQGTTGVCVVMLDQSSGRSRTLEVGEAVLDATLLRASGETARFKVGGSEWTLGLGQTLADRRPAEPSANMQ